MIAQTKTDEETRRLGRRLGALLRGGDLVLLIGDLGAGKTTFTQGLAKGAGFTGRVSSPTFTLTRYYRAKNGRTIYHVDLYRVGAAETGDIGLEEYLDDPKGITVVEWPAAGGGYFPKERLEVRLSHKAGGRSLAFKGVGARWRGIAKKLA